MAITLVTGVPRSGKTLYSVSLIDDAIKQGREVYSDIDGIENFEGVIKYDGDWRDTPEGSLIVFDEVHKRWPASGQSGMSKDQQIKDLDEHGHKGYDIVLITQWPTKVHFEVRTNVSKHIHVVRTMGAASASLYEWNQAQSSPDRRDTRDGADVTPFPYPKKLYNKYKSASIHNVKFKLPGKIKFLGVVVLTLLIIMYRLLFGGESALFADSQVPLPSVPTVSVPPIVNGGVLAGAKPATPSIDKTVLGCISSALDCICYNTENKPIDMTFNQCLNTMEKPLRFPMVINTNL